MNKRWKFKSVSSIAVQQLNQSLNINPIFCELLVARGINSFEAAKNFFRPDLGQLHDPFLLKNMDRAVARLEAAVKGEEKILLYGDYDVDGTAAVSLMFDFLQNVHSNLEFYIPDRYEEGYGLSEMGVEFAAAVGASLILCFDCGSTDHQSAALAQEKGIDLIICDHHIVNDSLPIATAIINPKQPDCCYPCKALSATALAFKFAQAYAQSQGFDFDRKVKPLLDLVVLSLACDMVELVDENRILAFWGLIQFNESPRLSLEVLREQAQRRLPFSIQDLVFGVGSVINAAGRMEHGREAVKMLLAKDRQSAVNQAEFLSIKNQERRNLQEQILAEAQAIIADDPSFHDKRCTIVYRPHWHQGVIGVVAAKLVEKYHRPTIVFTKSKGHLLGSARSVGNFNIHQAIAQAGQLLLNFGGHQYAAGLSLEEEDLDAFSAAFEDLVYHSLTTEDELPTLLIDTQLEMKWIDEKFWNILRQFAPFGPGNPQPVFMSKMVKDTGYSKLVKEEHIKLLVRQGDSEPIEGIAYGFGNHFEALSSRKPFHLCYAIEQQFYRGRRRLQLVVRDMKF